jgi:hypothetical protein
MRKTYLKQRQEELKHEQDGGWQLASGRSLCGPVVYVPDHVTSPNLSAPTIFSHSRRVSTRHSFLRGNSHLFSQLLFALAVLELCVHATPKSPSQLHSSNPMQIVLVLARGLITRRRF